MTTEELGRTRFDKFLEFVRETRKAFWLLLILLTIFTLGWFDIQIPFINPFKGERVNFLIGMVVGAIILYMPSKWFVRRFYTVDSDIIFEVTESPDDDNAKVKRYEVGKEKMNRMTVDGKTPISWRNARGKTTYLVRNCDLKGETLTTTHHAEMSDIELMEYRSKVEEARLRTKKWSLIGIKLYSKWDTLIESIEARFWKKKTDEYMESAGMDKELVKESVEEQIPELETEDDDEFDLQSMIESENVSGIEVNLNADESSIKSRAEGESENNG